MTSAAPTMIHRLVNFSSAMDPPYGVERTRFGKHSGRDIRITKVSPSSSIRTFCAALTHRTERTPGTSGWAAPASGEAGLPLRRRAERTPNPEFIANKTGRESFTLALDVKQNSDPALVQMHYPGAEDSC